MPYTGKEALSTKPAVIVTCNFNQFSAVLTSRQLIIQNSHTTDAFHLSHINSIGLFNNHPLHTRQQQLFIKRRRQLYWFIGTPLLALSCLLILPAWPQQAYGFIAAPFLSLLISSFIPVNASAIRLQSALIIETAAGASTFACNCDNNTEAITCFLQKLTENRTAITTGTPQQQL